MSVTLAAEEQFAAPCRRVRYEDPVADPGREEEIRAFLGLEPDGATVPALLASEPMAPAEEAGPPTGRAPVPADYLPPPLRQKVRNGLKNSAAHS